MLADPEKPGQIQTIFHSSAARLPDVKANIGASRGNLLKSANILHCTRQALIDNNCYIVF